MHLYCCASAGMSPQTYVLEAHVCCKIHNRLNAHCEDSFDKGLNMVDVHLYVKDQYSVLKVFCCCSAEIADQLQLQPVYTKKCFIQRTVFQLHFSELSSNSNLSLWKCKMFISQCKIMNATIFSSICDPASNITAISVEGVCTQLQFVLEGEGRSQSTTSTID